MLVRDVMTPDPLCTPPTSTLAEVLDMMARYEIHELPVTEDGRLTGIVTQRDLLAVLGRVVRTLDVDEVDAEVLEQLVEEVMTTEVEAVREWTRIGSACRILAHHRFGSLPVIDGEGRVVGILSVTDVLGVAADTLDRS